MALNLYRRHRDACEAKHPVESRSGEFEERKKTWKRCACRIFASGTLSRTFRRKDTGKNTWEEAKTVATEWEHANTWEPNPTPQTTPPPVTTPCRITIAEATNTFLSLRQGEQIAPPTLRKYRTFTKQLTAYAEGRGYVMLDQFTSADIDQFYTGLKLAVRTKGKRLGTIRSFFRFCTNRTWLATNPVSTDLKPPQGASKVKNKTPYTDDELQHIITACDKLTPITWTNGKRSGTWNGEDAKDFIWTLTYTGLRISDVALFTIERLHGNNVHLRAKKNGGNVFTYVPDWLRDRLQDRAKKHGPMLFIPGTSERLETITDIWRRRLNKVFKLAGHVDETPTPHRFRHTFARILLERGVPVTDVADLLGDDENTVRKHYSRWVPERQARLTKILQEAFDDKPKPKIINIR